MRQSILVIDNTLEIRYNDATDVFALELFYGKHTEIDKDGALCES